jgi:RNA polymerase sigma-70 factor (ECF subfamily)
LVLLVVVSTAAAADLVDQYGGHSVAVRGDNVRSVVGPDELARFRAGDPDAVRAVFREYGGLVFAVALRTLGSRQLAEEATQETFVKAWRAAGSYDATREIGPWLATIARRAAIDLHRREARRPAVNVDDVLTDPAVVDLPPGVDRAYDVWAVREAIDELPADEREVVRLQHLEELTQVEVAERLGIPVGTVKSRSHRAHRTLAARLGHLREADG